MASKREKTIIHETVTEAEDILTEIDNTARVNDAAVGKRKLAALLLRLYLSICKLQQYKRDKEPSKNAILEADNALLGSWRSLLKTIQALSGRVPNGYFLAARMMLFLMHAFIYQEAFPYDLKDSDQNRHRVKNQMELAGAVDEALQSQLCLIWEESEHTDDFRWALTHLESKDDSVHTDYNQAAMMALSPEDLWKVPGMTGQQHWRAKPGDDPIYEPFKNATSYEFAGAGSDDSEDEEEKDEHGSGDDENSNDEGSHTGGDDNGEEDEDEEDTGDVDQPIICQTLYSNGPLEADMEYCLVKKNVESWMEGPRLTISRQFVQKVTHKS